MYNAGENVTTEDNNHLAPKRFSSRQYARGSIIGGGSEPNNKLYEIAEKRYLLDQALDHELDALI